MTSKFNLGFILCNKIKLKIKLKDWNNLNFISVGKLSDN